MEKLFRKLVGEFLGYQIYRSICMSIGQYQVGNDAKPLIDCDFGNDKKAGVILRYSCNITNVNFTIVLLFNSKLMAAGSTKPWRELVSSMTVEQIPKISSMPFLEYFEPLNVWLTEDNYKKNLKVGWNKSTSKLKYFVN